MVVNYAQIASAAMDTGFAILNKSKTQKAVKKATAEVVGGAEESLGIEQDLFGQTEGQITPFVEAGTGGVNRVADLLGANGVEAERAAFENFSLSPGTQFQVQEGTRNALGGAASLGMAESGSTLKELQRIGQGAAAGEVNNRIAQLLQLSGIGANTGVNLGALRGDSGQRQGGLVNLAASARAGGILGKNQALQDMLAKISEAGEKVAGAFGPGGGGGGGGSGGGSSFFGFG